MSDLDGLRDGTALGCIGRCKACGRAIQLSRVGSYDVWLHFTDDASDHLAVLNPGVCDE